VLQQSDIDGAAASIMAAHPAPNPTDALQVINRRNSRLLETPAPSCGTRVTADHAVGDKIGQSVVFFTYVCSGSVYDEAGAEQVATNLLTARAARDLPPFFKPEGEISSTITSVTLTDPQKATFRLTVIAQGTWGFQF
jgi:hypothetical protein